MKQIKLWTAIVTPFTEDMQQIDYASFLLLLKEQESAGNGVILLGSTGEGLSLSNQERKDFVRFACEQNLSIPLMVGVPSYNLETALDWIEFANSQKISGYLLTTPIYTKPGVEGQIAWFKQLLDKSKHQCMLYNIPSRAGVKLHSEVVKNLASHPNFYAIKDSGGQIETIVEYKLSAPDIMVYCGDDNMLPAYAAEAASGLISVASNIWPLAVKKYVDQALERKIFHDKIWWKVCKALFAASNPIPVKVLLAKLGKIKSASLRLPLSSADLKSAEELLEVNELVENWQKNN